MKNTKQRHIPGKVQKGIIIPVLILIIAIILLGGGWYMYTLKNPKIADVPIDANNTASNPDTITSGQNVSTPPPIVEDTTGRQAYPTNNRTTGNLALYYFDDGSLKDLGEKGYLSEYAGIGPTNLSWNEFFTAYVRNAPGNVLNSPQIVIIDHSTLEKKTIFSAGKNKSIVQVRWSPHDEKILWESGDLYPSTGEGGEEVTNIIFRVYDVKTQKTTTLPSYVEEFGSFINDHRIVIGSKNKFEIFNLDTLAIEQGAYDKELGFMPVWVSMPGGVPDFQFSIDGTKVHFSGWAKPAGGSGLKDMDNVIGNMTTKTFMRVSPLETFVSSSSFAPNGKSVAYTERRPGSNPGIDDIVVYDVDSKKKTTIGEGDPFRWIDDNRFVFHSVGGEKVDYYVYDKTLKKATRMVGVNW
jgi:hypothetical protein